MKSTSLLLSLMLLMVACVCAQNVGINSDVSTPDGSAMLDVKSTTKGLLPPRMTSEQIAAIESPAEGLIVFNTSTKKLTYYNGTTWKNYDGADALTLEGYVTRLYQGTVSDTNSVPLALVRVGVQGQSAPGFYTYTNALGEFTLEYLTEVDSLNIKNGILEFSKAGYRTQEYEVLNEPEFDTIVSVTLHNNTWPAKILAATVLNSPVLSALATQYGQISLDTLTGIFAGDFNNAIQDAFAVGVDLSTLNAGTIPTNPLIQAALRLGTPIVFESMAALTNYMSGGGITIDSLNAANDAATMAASIGIGLQSQATVVIPPGSNDLNGFSEIFCLGASDIPGLLSLGTLDYSDSTLTPSQDPGKIPGFSASLPPVTDPLEILSLIDSVLNQSISKRSVAADGAMQGAVATRETIPVGITKKEYVIRFGEYVWYPRNRSQDFVMQVALRLQIFIGSGGTKKWVRFLVDDADGTTGFLNRGDLYFRDDDDKGYFTSNAQVRLLMDDWITFSGRSPGYDDAGADRMYTPNYPVETSTSETSFNVDYVDNGVNKTWTSHEVRQFRADEFECQTWPGADWRWRLMMGKDPCWARTHRLDRNRDGDPKGYDWAELASFCGNFQGSVGWPLKISRGTDQMGLHPKVQAIYWVPAGETRSALIKLQQTEKVWNIWTESAFPGDRRYYRNEYGADIEQRFWLNFEKNAPATPLWSSGTAGNPGAYKVMQNDGNLVIYSAKPALWDSNTSGNPGATLHMQSDGNLVIYTKDGTPIWASGTAGNPGAYKVMQNDGNLVIKAANGTPIWASGTGGNNGATAVMQDDGNYVIYAKNGTPLWSSGTSGNIDATLHMQSDGNLVIYNKNGTAIWASNTYGHPGAYDKMQDDGNYVIYIDE